MGTYLNNIEFHGTNSLIVQTFTFLRLQFHPCHNLFQKNLSKIKCLTKISVVPHNQQDKPATLLMTWFYSNSPLNLQN